MKIIERVIVWRSAGVLRRWRYSADGVPSSKRFWTKGAAWRAAWKHLEGSARTIEPPRPWPDPPKMPPPPKPT